MTYPVDDAGNVRVDFVWGHMPMQPDQQRVNTGGEDENITTDGNWTVIKETGSSTLIDGWDSLSFPTGDGGNTRTQTFEWGNHDMITEGYSNYPSFIENYAGDGDTGLEAVVPDLSAFAVSAMDDAVVAAGLVYASATTGVGATTVNDGKLKTQSPAAGVKANLGATVTATLYLAPTVPNLLGLNIQQVGTALTNAGLVGANTLSTGGATALNNGKVKTQAIAAGTKVNTGATVNYVLYNYVVTANTNIAGINQTSFPGHSALTGDEVYMFLTGRTTKPAVGNTITIASNTNATINGNWTVSVVEDNDSFNTGGTVVTMTKVGGGLSSVATNSGGTWIVA
jgi:hypothetical protein